MRAHDRLEQEADSFHAAVRAGFLRLADAEPHRYLVLDAGRPPQELHHEVWARLEPLLEVSS